MRTTIATVGMTPAGIGGDVFLDVCQMASPMGAYRELNSKQLSRIAERKIQTGHVTSKLP